MNNPSTQSKEELNEFLIDARAKSYFPKLIFCLLVSICLLTLSCKSTFFQLIALMTAPAFLSFVFLSKKYTYGIICVVASLALSFWLAPAYQNVFIIVLPAICALCIASCFANKDTSKTPAVASCFLVLCSSFVILLLANSVLGNNEQSFIEYLNAVNDVFISVFQESLKIAGKDELDSLTIANLKNTLLISYPAYAALIFIIISYLIVTFFGSFMRIFGYAALIEKRDWKITMSKTSSVIYVIIHILYFILSFFKTNTVFIALMLLVYILSPAYFVIGLRAAVSIIKSKADGMKKALLYILIFFAFLLFGSMLSFLFIGFGISVSLGLSVIYTDNKRL